MARDWGLEWRLVPGKARESCRWQSVDGAWVSVTLGHQKDITKIVVAASDGRVEVVEGYEEGLNVARRWRSSWTSRRSSAAAGAARPSEPLRQLEPQKAEPPLERAERRSSPASSPAPDPGRSRPDPSRLSAPPLGTGSGRVPALGRDGDGADSPQRAAGRGGPRTSPGRRPDLGPPLSVEDQLHGWQSPERGEPRKDGGGGQGASTMPNRPQRRASGAPARSTPSRPLPDLSRSFPPGPRPEPQRWSSPQHREDGAEGSSRPPGGPPSRPPLQEMTAEPTGSRSFPPQRTTPSGFPLAPTRPASLLPQADARPRDEGLSGQSRPLPPLVPERVPTGPYAPVTDADILSEQDPPRDEGPAERLRRLSRPPRR